MPKPDKLQIPGGAKTAAIIWIVTGALGLIGVLVAIGGSERDEGMNKNLTGVMICTGLLCMGIQILRGILPGLKVLSITSLAIGVLSIGAGVLGISVGTSRRVVDTEAVLLAAGLFFAVGAGALVAGILGLKNNAAYKVWQQAKDKNRKGQQRDSEADREDEDDQPRRRGKADDADQTDQKRRRKDDA